MTGPDPSNCHFFRNGWHERFRQVARESLDAYLAAHPEIPAVPEAPAERREDVEFGI